MKILIGFYLAGVLFALGLSGRPFIGMKSLKYIAIILLSWFGAGALIQTNLLEIIERISKEETGGRAR